MPAVNQEPSAPRLLIPNRVRRRQRTRHPTRTIVTLQTSTTPNRPPLPKPRQTGRSLVPKPFACQPRRTPGPLASRTTTILGLVRGPTISSPMNTITETNTRLIASSRNWIEGEAVRQLCATARLPGVTLAVGLPDLHPGKGGPIGAAPVMRSSSWPAPPRRSPPRASAGR